MKARKPEPFRLAGELVAACKTDAWTSNPRNIDVVDGLGLRGRDARRLAAWLTRAAAWVEEGSRA